MTANDFIRVGERYFIIYLPYISWNEKTFFNEHGQRLKVEVTEKIRTNNNKTIFVFKHIGGDTPYTTVMWDVNVHDGFAFLEGDNDVLMAKDDKHTLKKALMAMAYKKTKQKDNSTISRNRADAIRHNTRLILKILKEL